MARSALEILWWRLLWRGAPVAYARRLVAELAEHRQDMMTELMAGGVSEDEAGREADRRIGNPVALADLSMAAMRRPSFLGRHRVLCLLVIPALMLPLSWGVLLGLAAWATGMFSTSFKVGSLPHSSRTLLWVACGLCEYAMPAMIGGIFHILARRKFCGRVWSWTPAAMLSLISSIFVVKMFVVHGSPAGRLVIGFAGGDDSLKIILPLSVLFFLEAMRWCRRNDSCIESRSGLFQQA